ncbi:MAG: response regulator [Phycisphaerae bacterium]|nr:response regulator [Phycisphaerae bacterium]
MADPLDGKRVLLVDDDPEIVLAIKTILEDSGASVLTAGDGDAAVAMAEEQNPDLMILDAMLPKRSGFLVLERVRGKWKGEVRLPIIMITGNQGKRHQVWAESLGVDDYINKPFRMERLIQSVEKLLGN